MGRNRHRNRNIHETTPADVVVEIEIESTCEPGDEVLRHPAPKRHETPLERELTRRATVKEQLKNINPTNSDEDVQIDRYRAGHVQVDRHGKPHTMIDDELDMKPSDLYTETTAQGDPIVRPLAHEIAGAKQGILARHAAIKRQRGLSEDDVTISPVSGGQKF